jgi:hypothetical protein
MTTRLPTAKVVVDAISPLTAWYRKYKPEVKRIAITRSAMLRISEMIEHNNARGFTRHPNGEIYFDGFKLYVHSEDLRE